MCHWSLVMSQPDIMSQNKNNKNLNTATPISFDYESRRGAEDNSRLNKIISGSKKATVYALLAVLAANFLFGPTAVNANLLDDLNKLNKEAEAKKKEIENLKNEINVYTKNIQSKQQESITLQNQIQIFNDKIAKIELDIQALVLEVEALEIEIQEIKLQIEQASEKIDKQKTLLTEYIRRINKNDQTTYLEILVLNNSFYEFFDEVKNLTDVQDDLKDSIVVIKQLKEQLDRQQVALEEKLRKVEELKQRQENEIRNLAENKDAKKRLLAETLSQEQKFQQLLEQARTERLAANAAVVKIENDVRQKLEALDDLDSGALPGQLLLSWPVAPNRGISTYFRDPTYPFRYLFEHTAIDK